MHLLHVKANEGSAQYLHLSWSQTSGSLIGQLECHFTQWKRTGTDLGGRAYHLDIVEVSSIKCHDSNTVELNEGRKLFSIQA